MGPLALAIPRRLDAAEDGLDRPADAGVKPCGDEGSTAPTTSMDVPAGSS